MTKRQFNTIETVDTIDLGEATGTIGRFNGRVTWKIIVEGEVVAQDVAKSLREARSIFDTYSTQTGDHALRMHATFVALGMN